MTLILMMKKSTIHFSVLILALFSLVPLGCATGPTHPSLQSASLPKLIPLRDFVANTKSNFNYQVSPDGKKVAWIAVKGVKLTIYFKILSTGKTTAVNTHSKRGVRNFYWAQDSRTLFYLQDHDGDENYHVFALSIDHPDDPAVDLTPLKGTRATIVSIPRNDSEHIFIQHNHRDKSVFDLFRLDLKTKELTEVDRNPGDVYYWLIDDDGVLQGRSRKNTDENDRFEVRSEKGKGWRKVVDWKFDETFYVLDFSPESDEVWVMSNLKQDKIALLLLNLNTGMMREIYSEADVDLDSVSISKITRKPLFAQSMPGYPRVHFFDADVQAEYRTLSQRYSGYLMLESSDNSEHTLVLAVSSEKKVSHYLYQRETRQMTLLGTHPLSKYSEILSSTKPIAFKSRDGWMIHGYLTIPHGLAGKKLPMVLKVHGGPWARDRYHLNNMTQFLANRGYAVLQVNYRGSTGYGKKFMEAAKGEFAGKMHTDLIDGVQWAVQQGIADRQSICISGGSYGGYATLVGMTFTPDVFACGIDVVGPSNLVSLLKNTPPYWKNGLPFWYKYVGNPEVPAERKDMENRSPLFKVDHVKNPLLIVQGANDPRVKQQESDQMVKALRQSGKDVEYLLFEDEGHGIRKWTNNLKFQRRVEEFLARNLGGRSNGFDYYQLGALIF